ncbi:MAG: hydrogenase maturation protease [Gemmatimonadaceae bacterium]|nr:hydrogenase maturation protease [Gemmatimonadaceae bacterium]
MASLQTPQQQDAPFRRGTVVIALGDPHLADDGIGPEVLSRLARMYDVGPEVVLEDVGPDGGRALPLLERAERVLFIDAIRAGAAPGTVLRLEGSAVSSTATRRATIVPLHSGGVVAAIERAGALPPQAVTLGIEPELLERRKGLTASVSARVDDLLDAVIGQLRTWGHEVRVMPMRSAASPFPKPQRG